MFTAVIRSKFLLKIGEILVERLLAPSLIPVLFIRRRAFDRKDILPILYFPSGPSSVPVVAAQPDKGIANINKERCLELVYIRIKKEKHKKTHVKNCS